MLTLGTSTIAVQRRRLALAPLLVTCRALSKRHAWLCGTLAMLLAMVGAEGLHRLFHLVLGAHGCHHATFGDLTEGLELLTWMAEPGRPDATFGGLCVFSNVFFAMLAPVFWLQRRMPEVVLVGLVTVASTVYHGLQITWGPLHAATKLACVSDISMALTLTACLAARYPQTRSRAVPALVACTFCFVAPSLLPHGRVAEVGYSLLHSAWHGFSALAAYAVAGGSNGTAASEAVSAMSRLGGLTACGALGHGRREGHAPRHLPAH